MRNYLLSRSAVRRSLSWLKINYFKAIILIIFTIKSAGSSVIGSYAQQRKPSVNENTGNLTQHKFNKTHLILSVETLKLLISLIWSSWEIFWQMQRQIKPIQEEKTEHKGQSAFDFTNNRSKTVNEANAKHSITYAIDVDNNYHYNSLYNNVEPSTNLRGFTLCTYTLPHLLWKKLICDGRVFDVIIMSVPALVYYIQNYLFLLALSLLDPTMVQFLYQLRIPITAFLMKVTLHKKITGRQWIAISILCLGVIITKYNLQTSREVANKEIFTTYDYHKNFLNNVNNINNTKEKSLTSVLQLTEQKAHSTEHDFDIKNDITYHEIKQTAKENNRRSIRMYGKETIEMEREMSGVIVTLSACIISCASSVFIEYIYKRRTKQSSLAIRNVQLSFFSILIIIFLTCMPEVWYMPGTFTEKTTNYISTFYDGFTQLVWGLVLIQSAGGIIVSLVMKYADNILKSFCTAVSIIIVGIASMYLFDLIPNIYFIIGSLLVFSAIFMYSS